MAVCSEIHTKHINAVCGQNVELLNVKPGSGRSRWPCSLRRGSAATPLLGLCFRIPLASWMFVSCECCLLSGRGLCVGLITRPEESYRLWCVGV